MKSTNMIPAAEILALVRAHYPDVEFRSVTTQTRARGTNVVTEQDKLEVLPPKIGPEGVPPPPA